MHDPNTVAFEIRWPLRITVWHVDPEKRGDDDSCDWFGRSRPLSPREQGIVEATYGLETLLDNRPHYPDSPEHRAFQELKAAIHEWRRRSKWRLPVRWHVWHWSFQVHFVLTLKRWLFSRCAKCGSRFPWDYSPVSTSWAGGGPRWFRDEPHTYHFECVPAPKPVEAKGAAA